ncbi:hypothetical protein BZL39_C07640 [Zygosaccharomyces parabailii]|nr:hypothetical protein BZL39_C07640 [Zygosaccharomyces parabailii]CDH15653.1 related to Weak similarity to Y.pseudotuberculosis CDP-3,6-dideoxy-D-glycero-L-glycero-4-hexulose-5-epimerase [Zygosaccharomyces bailii ISA1307]
MKVFSQEESESSVSLFLLSSNRIEKFRKMKVFVTGASGFIGNAVVVELSKAGHQVVGLARSAEAAGKIKSLGTNVEVLMGGLQDLDVLKRGAQDADGIIHLAFIHDFKAFDKSCEIDRDATVAMLESIKGTEKPFVYTSGILLLLPGKILDENSPIDPHVARGITEEIALSFKNKGIRVSSVRLPPSVHGKGDKAFIPFFMKVARNSGKSAYIGTGENVWPTVARQDAAHLFRLALEKGRAGGVYHGVGEQGVKTKEIAGTIGQVLNVPVVSITETDASEYFGPIALFFAKDRFTSSVNTHKELAWQPHGPGLLEDIRENYV